MNVSKKKASKDITTDGYTYLTKRIVVSKAKAAGKRAATNAMVTMGYVVVAEGGSVIKKFADGSIEVLGQIPKSEENSSQIALD